MGNEIQQRNLQAFELVKQMQDEICKKDLPAETKLKLINELIVYQEPTSTHNSISDYLYQLKQQSTPEQKNILDAISVTYLDQHNTLTLQNQNLTKKIQSLENEQEKANELINELVAYKQKIEQEQHEKDLRRMK